MGDSSAGQQVTGDVLYLVTSGAPAPEGIPALVEACHEAGWRVVVLSTPMGTRFIDCHLLEQLTGEPVRSEYRMPGTGKSLPPADAVIACPLTFNSVNKFAHGHPRFAAGRPQSPATGGNGQSHNWPRTEPARPPAAVLARSGASEGPSWHRALRRRRCQKGDGTYPSLCQISEPARNPAERHLPLVTNSKAIPLPAERQD